MTNGHDAEVDVILSGGRSHIDKYLVETVMELKQGQEELSRVCKERGRTCPVIHPELADPVEGVSAKTDEDGKRVWLMWTIGSKLGYVLLTIIVTLINVTISMVLYGRP